MPLKTWASEIMKKLLEIANFLDKIEKSKKNKESLKNISGLIENPDLTPSGKMLTEMNEKKLSFLEFCIRRSKKNQMQYLALDLSLDELKFFKNISNESHKSAQRLHNNKNEDFDAYIKNFVNSYKR